MLLNDDIVDIEKPDGLCSPTFVAQDCFTRIKFLYETFKICIDNKWWLIKQMVLIKL